MKGISSIDDEYPGRLEGMVDLGTTAELDCASCGRTAPHAYRTDLAESGVAVTGVLWRSSISGWACSRCNVLSHTSQEIEDQDPITGEWQPRIRRSVRVPIAGQPLHVVVRGTRGLSWNPAGINLSTTGILVEFPEEVVPPALEPGADLKIELRFENHAVVLDAEVKRRDGNRYGIAFASSRDRDFSLRPDPLRVLVGVLEQRWLAARAR
jgi:hypothetical protein